MAPLRGTMVDDLGSLEKLVPAWDALATSMRRPRSAPAWTLAWYERALDPSGAIRAVVVTDGDELVGVCPLYVTRTGFGLYRYALAAPMLHGVEPVAAPGRHTEVGEVVGAVLAGAHPTPDVVDLDWGSAECVIPAAIRRGWGRPHPALFEEQAFPSLRVVHGQGDLDAWLGERSYKFRKTFRAEYRKFQAEGFRFEVSADPDAIEARLPDMQRLYEVRRAARGGAGPTFDATFMAVVADAVRRSEPGRVRLCTIERTDEVVASTMVMSAGDVTSAWLSGFDEMWAHLGPTRVNLTLCIGESLARGDASFDLGAGGQMYKYRFTEDHTLRQRRVLSRRGLRPFHSPAQLLTYPARQSLVGAARGARTALTRTLSRHNEPTRP